MAAAAAAAVRPSKRRDQSPQSHASREKERTARDRSRSREKEKWANITAYQKDKYDREFNAAADMQNLSSRLRDEMTDLEKNEYVTKFLDEQERPPHMSLTEMKASRDDVRALAGDRTSFGAAARAVIKAIGDIPETDVDTSYLQCIDGTLEALIKTVKESSADVVTAINGLTEALQAHTRAAK